MISQLIASFQCMNLSAKFCRIASQQQAYVDLEDEFRMALRIEENRFCEVGKT